MKVTEYLKKKLMKLENEFAYKSEKFKIISYGGNGDNSYIEWEGDKSTIIHMKYTLKKVGHDSYLGIERVNDISIYQ